MTDHIKAQRQLTINSVRQRANSYLKIFRISRIDALALLDELDDVKAEVLRVRDYAERMDALAEERLARIEKLELDAIMAAQLQADLENDLDAVDGNG